MPIPPPPPPGPPPPPAFNLGGATKSSGGGDQRGALLQSIRQGTRLKKAETNDRSAPALDGKSNNKGPGPGARGPLAASGGANGGRANGLNVPPGLGGLFAGGMPKLKPVGGSSPNRTPAASNNSNNSYNSSNHIGNSTTSLQSSPAKPVPPAPPPSNMKPNSVSNSSISQAIDERKTTTQNFGKPSLAPKPPGMNGNGAKPSKPNPPPKLPTLYIPPAPPMQGIASSSVTSSNSGTPSTPPGGVNRAQSMRMPKSASPTIATAASVGYRTMGRSAGQGIAAMNAAANPPPPPRIISNGVGRPRASPLRPPSARPPPPPVNKVPPGHPPPPPPAVAPPPPPHRTSPAPVPPQLRINGSLGPLPAVPQGGAPPPPPTRNSSMRSNNSVTSIGSSSGSSSSSVYNGIDLESRFGHLFHRIEELPTPEHFSGIMKNYPSKSAQSTKRQPAPQPPTQMQLGGKLWVNNTSAC